MRLDAAAVSASSQLEGSVTARGPEVLLGEVKSTDNHTASLNQERGSPVCVDMRA